MEITFKANSTTTLQNRAMSATMMSDTTDKSTNMKTARKNTPGFNHALFMLELKHDRNRRPSYVTLGEQNRWAVTLDDPNTHTVCVSPESWDGVAGQENCEYQSAICKAISILLNSDFAHNEGFVEVISSLCEARGRSRKQPRK